MMLDVMWGVTWRWCDVVCVAWWVWRTWDISSVQLTFPEWEDDVHDSREDEGNQGADDNESVEDVPQVSAVGPRVEYHAQVYDLQFKPIDVQSL